MHPHLLVYFSTHSSRLQVQHYCDALASYVMRVHGRHRGPTVGHVLTSLSIYPVSVAVWCCRDRVKEVTVAKLKCCRSAIVKPSQRDVCRFELFESLSLYEWTVYVVITDKHHQNNLKTF